MNDESDRPNLESLVFKHPDDEDMYRARCKAIKELVYQLEDENNLIALKIAQTRRRIAEKKALLQVPLQVLRPAAPERDTSGEIVEARDGSGRSASVERGTGKVSPRRGPDGGDVAAVAGAGADDAKKEDREPTTGHNDPLPRDIASEPDSTEGKGGDPRAGAEKEDGLLKADTDRLPGDTGEAAPGDQAADGTSAEKHSREGIPAGDGSPAGDGTMEVD